MNDSAPRQSEDPSQDRSTLDLEDESYKQDYSEFLDDPTQISIGHGKLKGPLTHDEMRQMEANSNNMQKDIKKGEELQIMESLDNLRQEFQGSHSRDKQLSQTISNQTSFQNSQQFQNAHYNAPAGTTMREKASHFNVFSNSFDESGALQLDLKRQRNCKSSTRTLNKTQVPSGAHHRQGGHNQQLPIPLLSNMGGANAGGATPTAMLTSNSLSNKHEVFNNYLKSKQNSQMQNQYQQALIGSIQRANGNSIDIKPNNGLLQQTQDLSNRSHLGHSSGQLVQTPYANTQGLFQAYAPAIGGGSSSGTSSKPITPHQNPQHYQSVILSASSEGKDTVMNHQNPQQINNMDPYSYLKWKQQKYKSSRSIQANNGGSGYGYGGFQTGAQTSQMQRQNSNNNIMNNSQQIMISNPHPQFAHHQPRTKGNQTQKNNKSSCSSGNGSGLNSSSTGLTMGGGALKSLQQVSNPQYFISLRYSDRKVQDLKGIQSFKNLSELDISGNLLTEEIPELKVLQFLKKLNLSNNQIVTLYPLPHNLEILNLSYNKLKNLSHEVTANLKNLTTLEVTSNGLETLDGVQPMKRLKRLLSKNNQVQDLQPLKEIYTLVEIDLENNPVDNYSQLISLLEGKKDILVVNLKLSPVFLTISSYEQLCSELESHLLKTISNVDEKSSLESFKLKLKHFQNGCLYRSKRAYQKMRALQQHSKRSSSNFSNGSSSCGRVTGGGVHTGGRAQNNLPQPNGVAPFSPLWNPNQAGQNQGVQNVTQRLEDFEQLYDEILDEEEEHERKLLRIQRRKLKKQGLGGPDQEDDSADEDYEESMSMYEDEDDIHPTMSFDEDIEELQSYRNAHPGHPEPPGGDFLNESTADFNKEIKQINQELREQFGNELDIGSTSNVVTVPDHLQSFQSTQSLNQKKGSGESSQVNTQKKNPISFKLDLSKCTNQQSEEDEEEFAGEDSQDPEGQFDIPGLQYVKVTDDSFRQYKQSAVIQTKQEVSQKPINANPQQQSSSRHQQSNQNTLRGTQATNEIVVQAKTQAKQIIIPKLQLGILQQQNIPLKPGSLIPPGTMKNISAAQSLRSAKDNKSKRQQQQEEVKKGPEETCINEACLNARMALNKIREDDLKQRDTLICQVKNLTAIIDEIKDIFRFSARGDLQRLPGVIRDFKSSTAYQLERAALENQNLRVQYEELLQWKQSNEDRIQGRDLEVKCQENERTISDLQDQISKLLSLQRQTSTTLLPPNFSSILFNDLDTSSQKDFTNTSIVQQPQTQAHCLLSQNPQYFYSAQSQPMLPNHQEVSLECDPQVESITKRLEVHQHNRKKQFHEQDIKKLKRPQSMVAGINQRRQSQGVKINSFMRVDSSVANTTGSLINDNLNGDNASVGANEYCSNHQLILPIDLSLVNPLDAKGTPLSQTMNRKVGHYLQRLKERNSSLQERLNGSFRDGSGSLSALNALQSPTPQDGKISILNLNKMTSHLDSNPYILSPSDLKQNESIASAKPVLSHQPSASYQSVQVVSSAGNQPNQNLVQGKGSTQGGPALLRKVSYKEGSNSRRYSQYNTTSGPTQAILAPQAKQELHSQHSQQLSHNHVNRFALNEYSERDDDPPTVVHQTKPPSQAPQPQASKKHSKTQRIHVNRVQYNQLVANASAQPKGGKQAKDSLENPLLIATTGYTTQQPTNGKQHVNLTQLFSGRLLNRQDSAEHTVVRNHVPTPTNGRIQPGVFYHNN